MSKSLGGLSVCLLSFLFVGCSVPAKKPHHPYLIDQGLRQVFPAFPFETAATVTYRSTGKIARSSSIESGNEQIVNIRRYERLPNGHMIHITVEKHDTNIEREGQRYLITWPESLKRVKLAIRVDCKSNVILEKRGFQQALDQIEKLHKPGIERDILISNLTSFVDRRPDLCSTVEGPFTLNNVTGKTPGHQWTEGVPIEGFDSSKMEAEFLGWHKNSTGVYAVLYGITNATAENKAISPPANADFKLVTYFLISSDWKRIIRDVRFNLQVSAQGRSPVIGSSKIDMVSELVE